MKALSFAQAQSCENAVGHVCRCRCGGALHGAKRFKKTDSEDNRSWYEQLPDEDPHYVPEQKDGDKPKQLSFFDLMRQAVKS